VRVGATFGGDQKPLCLLAFLAYVLGVVMGVFKSTKRASSGSSSMSAGTTWLSATSAGVRRAESGIHIPATVMARSKASTHTSTRASPIWSSQPRCLLKCEAPIRFPCYARDTLPLSLLAGCYPQRPLVRARPKALATPQGSPSCLGSSQSCWPLIHWAASLRLAIASSRTDSLSVT